MITVLASPPPRPPPVDPDDVNALNRKIFNGNIKVYMRVDTPPPPPRGTLVLKFDTLRGLEQLRSQPNDTCIPQIFKMQYLRKYGLIAFKFYTEVKNLKLHTKDFND